MTLYMERQTTFPKFDLELSDRYIESEEYKDMKEGEEREIFNTKCVREGDKLWIRGCVLYHGIWDFIKKECMTYSADVDWAANEDRAHSLVSIIITNAINHEGGQYRFVDGSILHYVGYTTDGSQILGKKRCRSHTYTTAKGATSGAYCIRRNYRRHHRTYVHITGTWSNGSWRTR